MSEQTIQAVIARATAAAEQLERDGIWTSADEQRMSVLFESATKRALQVPAFAERSRHMRIVVRRLVPASARPIDVALHTG